MTNAKAEPVKLGVQDATQRSIFEKELRDAIEKRKGKAPPVPQDTTDLAWGTISTPGAERS